MPACPEVGRRDFLASAPLGEIGRADRLDSGHGATGIDGYKGCGCAVLRQSFPCVGLMVAARDTQAIACEPATIGAIKFR